MPPWCPAARKVRCLTDGEEIIKAGPKAAVHDGFQGYANESIQVYDTYSSGQPFLFCFGGELVPLCQELLEAG